MNDVAMLSANALKRTASVVHAALKKWPGENRGRYYRHATPVLNHHADSPNSSKIVVSKETFGPTTRFLLIVNEEGAFYYTTLRERDCFFLSFFGWFHVI